MSRHADCPGNPVARAEAEELAAATRIQLARGFSEGKRMRHTKLVIPFLLGAALAMGCKATKEKSAAETKQDETAALQLGKAKTATREAAQAMEDYAYTRKAEFVVKMSMLLTPLPSSRFVWIEFQLVWPPSKIFVAS